MGKLKAVLITVVTIVVLGMAACFFYKPLYYRFYFNDRITGSIKASLDGVPVILDEACFAALEGFNVSVNEFSTDIAMKGGDYKTYNFAFFIQGVNEPVQVNIIHSNWWCVTDFELKAEASTEGNIVSFAYICTTIDENGEELQINRNLNLDADTDELEIFIGHI